MKVVPAFGLRHNGVIATGNSMTTPIQKGDYTPCLVTTYSLPPTAVGKDALRPVRAAISRGTGDGSGSTANPPGTAFGGVVGLCARACASLGRTIPAVNLRLRKQNHA
jgi:hypothetical protein